jgi:VWFA-related protein
VHQSILASGAFLSLRISWIVPGLLIASVSFAAQQHSRLPQPTKDANTPYTFRVDSKTVVLDIVVTDKHGRVVTNLKKQDFTIQEDAQPQQITSFDSPGASSLANGVEVNSSADLDRLAPEASVDIIVLDEINTRFEDMAFARYSLKKYLDAQPGRLVQPTMLVAVDLHHLSVLRDYTQNKNEILTSLDKHFVQYPWHLDSASWKSEQFSAAFASLMQVAESSVGHPGHKSMIWIGRGFPSVRIDTMQPEDAEQLADSIELCVNMLRDARVTLYTVDPVGVPSVLATDVDGLAVDDPLGGNIDFNTVAAATGGKAFFGRNDVNAEIETSVRNGANFYTLSYTPAGTSDAAKPFRKIIVTMKDPSLHAVTREGYYVSHADEPSSAKSAITGDRTKFDLFGASETTLVYDGVPITVARTAENPSVVRIHISKQAITWKDSEPGGNETANVQMLFATFDRKNKLLSRTARNIVVKNSSAQNANSDTLHDIDFLYGLPPNNATRLRVVVRLPGSDKVGAANLDLYTK